MSKVIFRRNISAKAIVMICSKNKLDLFNLSYTTFSLF